MGQKEDRSSQDASGWKEQDHQNFDVAYSLEESKVLPVDYVVDSEFVVVVAAALAVDDVAVAVAAVVATEVNADVVAKMAVAQM